MIDNLNAFADLFLYPLTQINDMGMISDVLLCSIVALCVVTFVREVFGCTGL